VSELASDLGFSREHLTRLFLLAFGAPPHAVLRRRQLQRAETLLRTTSASIIEIAVAAGFGTHRAFYRAFRAAFGTTPGRFRKITK
jgi:AraC-like DNA-binding protein